MGAGRGPDEAVAHCPAQPVGADARKSTGAGKGVWAFRVGKRTGGGRTGEETRRCGVNRAIDAVLVDYRLDSIGPSEAVAEKAVEFGSFAPAPHVEPPMAPRCVPRQRVELMPREGIVGGPDV